MLLTFVLLYTLMHKDFGRDPSNRAARDATAARWLAARHRGHIGLYDGFFGPGTGSFLVFLFVRVFGLDFLHASASAKIVNAASNLAAILLFGLTGELSGCWDSPWRSATSPARRSAAISPSGAAARSSAPCSLPSSSCLIAKTAWDATRALILNCVPGPDAAGSRQQAPLAALREIPMDVSLESLLGIALGIGLAAAAGFRMFVPLLAAGIAARTGYLPLTDGFQWLGSTPALLMLGTAAAASRRSPITFPGVDHAARRRRRAGRGGGRRRGQRRGDGGHAAGRHVAASRSSPAAGSRA